MSKRIEDNYVKLIQSLYPLLQQAEELKASIRPITEIAETIKAPFESISQTTEITKNMTSVLEAYVAAVRPIIRTADLNKMGLMSREIAELVNTGKLERIKQVIINWLKVKIVAMRNRYQSCIRTEYYV